MSCREGRADLGMRSANCTTLCRALQSSIPHGDALSQYTVYGPWVESFQDSWWDPEFPQLSQMVQSLPGFLNLYLNVWSPTVNKVIYCDLFIWTGLFFRCSLSCMFIDLARVIILGLGSGAVNLKYILGLFRRSA